MTQRQHGYGALAARPQADVLIVGGGINGLATFRDLALQGVDVALVERGDFVSGASSASSHMIHGGIRYLENGEFRLVHEAVRERNGLLRTAPHYVRPLRTTIPIFSTFSGVFDAPLRFLLHRAPRRTARGALLIKIGLVIYDSFSRSGGRVPRHEFRGRRRSLRDLPDLNPAVRYTATYWDASLHDPERLALDVLRDGRTAGGDRARAANYVEAVGATADGVRLRDAATGEEIVFSARAVVGAAGPWTDVLDETLGLPTRYMGGTKGSHIVLDNADLLAATGGRELFFEHEDGRIVLIYPLHDRVLVGTTDIEHDMADPLVCTEAEVDYFFGLIRHVLPGVRVRRDEIVHRFAGVRPLPGHGDMAPGFVSRDYRVEQTALAGGTPLLSLVGGKWTTFRASAETLTDKVLAVLGRTRRRTTRGLPIGGGRGYPLTPRARRAWAEAHAAGLGVHRAATLLGRYGTVAAEVMAAISADGDDRPLVTAPGYGTAEIRHLVRTEDVHHVDDILLRRTDLAFVGAATPACAAEVADIAGEVLGWDAATRAAEAERAIERVRAAVPRAAEESTEGAVA